MDQESDFDKLISACQNSHDRERLYSVRAKFNLHDEDAIWTYIAVLDHYQRIYEEMPAEIRKAADAESKRLAASACAAIADVAADEIKAALKRETRNSGLITSMRGWFSFVVVTVIAVTTADIVSSAESSMSKFELLKAAYSVPAGHVLIVMLLSIVVMYFLQLLDKKITEKTTFIMND